MENDRSNLGEGGRSSSSGYTVKQDKRELDLKDEKFGFTEARSRGHRWCFSKDLM